MPAQKWPDSLEIVRHGENAGNVARDDAEAAGRSVIDILHRDMDVQLSGLGERQAAALGRWIADRPAAKRPTAVLASPYVRAQDTAVFALRQWSSDEVPVVVDERLREREFGVLDRLTKAGIAERYPEQARARAHLGKFYHRPPGGESWADVILRLRSVLDTVVRDYRGERVMVVSHQVVVLMFRYLLERMTESEVLAIDRKADIANCSVTSYDFDPSAGRSGKLVLCAFNQVAPLVVQGAPVTEEPARSGAER